MFWPWVFHVGLSSAAAGFLLGLGIANGQEYGWGKFIPFCVVAVFNLGLVAVAAFQVHSHR